MSSIYCQVSSPVFMMPSSAAAQPPLLVVDPDLLSKLHRHGSLENWAQALVAMAGSFEAAQEAIQSLLRSVSVKLSENIQSVPASEKIGNVADSSENSSEGGPWNRQAELVQSDCQSACQHRGLSTRELEGIILARAARYGEIRADELAEHVYRSASSLGQDEEARRIGSVCEGLGFEADERANAGYVNRWLVSDAAAVIEDRVRVLSDLPRDAPARWRSKVAEILLARQCASAGLGGRRRSSAYEQRLRSAANRSYGVRHG